MRKAKKINAKKVCLSPAAIGPQGRVLVIDDEKWICESLKLLLSRKGLKVNSTLSGKNALGFIRKNRIDLAILDFNLPDMNGLEILEKIKKIDEKIPVIFMTGYGSETVSIRAFRLGIIDYFIKPFDPKKLVERVDEIIGSKKEKELASVSYNLPPGFEDNIEDSTNIGRAVNHLKNNFKTNISLEKISDVAGVSKYHFTRLFKRVMAISFTNYLNYLRVKKAEEFLSLPEANISEVAFEVGFNSLRQFERVFKNSMGKTAADYRKERFPDS